jgi:hypothetical protein
MPDEEPRQLSDQKLLIAMFRSVNDVRDMVRRSVKLIEQSQIVLRELDGCLRIRKPNQSSKIRHTSAKAPQGERAADC